MAKIITKGKRKRFIAVTAVALSVTLSLGVLAACGGDETSPEEEESAVSTPTDTQTIKNGNFEFFTEMTEDDLAARRNLIHSPNSWSVSTPSPASDTKSGIIDTKDEWDYIAKSGRAFTSIDDAYANWDNESVHVYDRLKFLDEYKSQIDALATDSEERTFFDTYRTGGSDVYSIDYEDVKDLEADFPDGITLHTGAKEGESHVLMLHNYENSDGVLGTATYATSSTTITLKGGTAAEVSVWVRTDKLTHYYESDELAVKEDGGAYIAVTNTVGSNSSSPQFIIKNINTGGAWEKYTVYIRANTFATTTYRLVLGLGRNTSSDNRLEGVNGYAFFDDVEAKTMKAADYVTKTQGLDEKVKSNINSSAKERIKDATQLAEQKKNDEFPEYDCSFALDLAAAEDFVGLGINAINTTITTTKETEGSLTKDSNDIVPDNNAAGSTTETNRRSITKATTYGDLEREKETNGYLKTIFESDFAGKFPFYAADGTTVDEDTELVMLLSTNGAAYTATLPEISLGQDEYMLISFFVKTSKIQTGKTGASITLVEGENKTTISAFDSTTVDTVDIDKDNKDIYNGWVQCFFIVKNETKDAADKTFHLELNYGPTSIVGSKTSDYSDGYAAFANFQTMELSKAQAGFASTGTYAKSVSLTATVKDTTRFDAAANSYNIEEQLSAPAGFRGISASKEENAADNIVTGLINKEYVSAYETAAAADDADLNALITRGGGSGNDWWGTLFGDSRRTARVATQPLVIYNKGAEAAPAYGYTLRTFSSEISANSSQRISLRLKVSDGLHAFVYLYDLSDPKTGLTNSFAPSVPKVTYWYDDEGNIVKGDPTADGFNKKTDILYYLQDNGLYTKAGETNGTYYANLHNYKTDDKGNLVTGGEKSQIVFYHNENDNTDTHYYAYRDGKEGSYTYSQVVENLPTDIARYEADDLSDYVSYIEISGNSATETTWAEVSFYVRTGSEAKTYGLAVWAGSQDNMYTIPAGAYLFVDSYKNESTSNFEAIREERVSTLLEDEDYRAENPADPTKKLEDKLGSAYALYSTYTFYDSDRYVRYDKSQDEDNIGSPWIDYVQSSNTEGIAWLYFNTLDATTGVIGSEVFIDYSVSEVSVAEHVYDTDEEPAEDEEDTADSGDTNIWLILSSALLAFVLIFAIVAVIVRKLHKKHARGKIKVAKEKPAKKRKKAAEAEEPAVTKETPKDDNDPYNE